MTSSALFGAQNRSDLRVEIPNSSSYTPVINTNPPSPFLTPLLDTPHNIPLPASPELSPPSPQSPALSPPLVCSPPPQSSIGRTNHSRKLRSSSSQVPPSPDRLLCDQEPPTDVQAHQLIDRAAFRQIIVFLKDLPEFKHWDFEADGLPELSKKVVGSKKTREASESRRTQNSGFWCTIPGCGSSITKKHNLRRELVQCPGRSPCLTIDPSRPYYLAFFAAWHPQMRLRTEIHAQMFPPQASEREKLCSSSEGRITS
ncbi:hypothetical protein P691DRAFT_666105 [Macrolepiota fuliginosa MF-IS2]|uniref:Uncharacterized protein n=1 Tax=Macrolepiota fuliginosa MF-IS2 TaxID=1400762 RepID=A0A9P6C677_9AGAR|nr:hypothetical protein P691DRAFT_666105 [Macrolepiota fuliginosa MF-IS2]